MPTVNFGLTRRSPNWLEPPDEPEPYLGPTQDRTDPGLGNRGTDAPLSTPMRTAFRRDDPQLPSSIDPFEYGSAVPRTPSPTTPPPVPQGGDPRNLWQEWWGAGNRARQSQNTSLQPFVDYLKQRGIDASVNVDPHGMGKGINLNGQFIKLLDGYDNPIWEDYANEGAGGGTGAAGGGGNDPSRELFINELLSRMESLRKPVDDPLAPLYQLMALTRVQNLQGEPFTGGDDAALRAKYMDPLTQARDAELQANKERIGARGMLPSSGLLDELNKTTNQGYQRGVAIGSNDLAVRAIDERQRRQMEQLDVLSDLLSQGRTARGEDDRRGQEIIELAALFPEMDERRLQMLLQASGDSTANASAASTSLLQQGSQDLQARLLQSRTDAERNAAWGEFFGSLLDNWDDIF
jgi:hypothetical protein